MTTKTEHRKILDDLFDAFTIIGRGNYVTMYDVKENIIRYSPAAVELFGLPGEYVSWKITFTPKTDLTIRGQ